MSILIFNAGMLAGAVLMWFGIHVGMRSRSNLDSQSAHWYGQWKAAAEAHVECDTMNMAEIERLRADVISWTAMAGEQRARAEAAEAERDRQRGAAEKHYARSESLLEQLTERDVALDRAVLKLAEAQAEVGRLEKAHTYSEASYFAAENALAAEAEVEATKLATGTTGPPGETWVDALSRTESLLLAAEARTARLVEALDGLLPPDADYLRSLPGDQITHDRYWVGWVSAIDAALAAAKASE